MQDDALPVPSPEPIISEEIAAEASSEDFPTVILEPDILARVGSQQVSEVPQDLYIPPDALRIFLETFEGPLDLLLYLIQRENFDILNIPIAEITRQYLRYISLMQELKLDLAAEYLLMAALLLEIKSRMLLPRDEEAEEEGDERDPRQRLIEQLQEYARIKDAAEKISQIPILGQDLFIPEVHLLKVPIQRPPPQIPFPELLASMRELLMRLELYTAHQITREPLSVRERMTLILDLLRNADRLRLQSLFTLEEGRHGVVVAMLAVLELCKEKLIDIDQQQAFGPLEVYPKPGEALILSDDYETDLD